MAESKFPRPTPDRCEDCGSNHFDGHGPTGSWDGRYGGGRIYTARCIDCGSIWERFAWGHEAPDEIHWAKQGLGQSPVSASINPALQVETGQIIAGTVVNVAPFGLFVELAPRLDGILLFWRSVFPETAKRYQQGQPIQVIVKAIDLDRVKVEVDLYSNVVPSPNAE